MAEVSVTTPGNSINDPQSKEILTRSKFEKCSYDFYNTHRFGIYTPFFVMEGVPGDKLPIRSFHDIKSYSLNAPLMQNITRNKDFYSVPMEAILPLNWEKIYTNPVIGDDVPTDAGTGVANFWVKVATTSGTLLTALRTILAGSSTDQIKLTAVFRFLAFVEYFYSNGSLINSLGCHAAYKCHFINFNSSDPLFDVMNNGDFDAFFDAVVSAIFTQFVWIQVNVDGQNKTVVVDPNSYAVSGRKYSEMIISVHDLLEYFRDDLNVVVNGLSTTGLGSITDWFDSSKLSINFVGTTEPYNLDRVCAYQLCVSHFYTNDHVDYVYSASLFRELIQYSNKAIVSSLNNHYFTINGLPYQYDALSAYFFVKAIDYANGDPQNWLTTNSVSYSAYRAYFSNLLSYRRSLRFVDYFTGSRTRPLAVGSVDANVVSNKVNIIDVTQNIQRQRFFNAVNRFGRKFREYIQGLSGVTPSVDYHNPLYLGHTSDMIYGVETENTGAAQLTNPNSVTSRLQSNGARYALEVDIDRPSVIIGISYYDIKRAYIQSTERPLMHVDRFDMFNPFMQFIGDQVLYLAELGSDHFQAGNPTFGYQLRHMEYKERYDQAVGGFVRNLPGFVFTNKSDDARNSYSNMVVSPDYIRSLPSELDPFFVSLTGYSNGSYFHFIVADHNVCDASRPMAYAPTIL